MPPPASFGDNDLVPDFDVVLGHGTSIYLEDLIHAVGRGINGKLP